jgi:DnaJ like chaperone protein
MPEPVRFARIAEAYSNSANVYIRPRSLPNNPCGDTVEISTEAQEKSREFLSKVKEESSSENSPSKRQPEDVISILNISTSASKDQIRKAYLAAIKRYHPDKFAGLCPEFRELAEEKSKQINLAYRKLAGM